jgi:hypothetical protein
VRARVVSLQGGTLAARIYITRVYAQCMSSGVEASPSSRVETSLEWVLAGL